MKNLYNLLHELNNYVNRDKIMTDIINFEINNDSDLLDYLLNYLNTDDLKDEFYIPFLKIISLQFNQSVENLNHRYRFLEEMNLLGNYGISKNHTQLYEIFDNLNLLFNNEKIEHYYTSGILSYLLIDKPLERYHHDLDVFINEKNLKKLEAVCDKYGFSFNRVIGIRNDETKRIMLKMYYKNINIPITIFMYEKELDGSIIQKDYFYKNDSDILYVEEIYNSKETVELSFDEQYKYHNNIPYKSISLEALYLCKDNKRKKDIYDCCIIKPFVDFEKLEKLKLAIKNNNKNKVLILEDMETLEFMKQNDRVKRKVLIK